MPLNQLDQGAEQNDYSLVLATATFRQPALEVRFQQETLAQTQKLLRTTMSFGVIFELSFWLTDVAALGYNKTTQMMLLARLMVALTVVLGFYLLAKYPKSLSVPKLAATLAEVAAMCAFIFVITNRLNEFHWHGMSMSIMLLVYYIFIPNSFVNACGVALASTLAFILLALHSGKLDNSDMVTMSLSLILANAFGFLAAHRQARVSRHEFQAREIERRALETQRQFVSMLSHEFRTPLATIDATVQRLGFALESQQPDFMPKIQKIQRAVARILNLLDNCLTDDRLATSDLVLHTEYVDLKDHIQRSYGESSAPSFQRLHLVLPDAPQWVNCDQHLIDIALSNLVNNALKYSPDNTPVTIRLEPDAHPGKIVIRVEDLGPGVPAADREQIFLKFFRSNSTQNVPGSGLGLHLARELVRRHGGNVRLVPESGHAGSIFTLTLPRSHLTHVMP